MSSPKYLIFVPILCQIIILLLLTSHLPNILSLDSSPTIAQCTPSLLLLIPCTAFVQRTSPSPGSCCGNLKQHYSQKPHYLCLFLNGTNLRDLSPSTGHLLCSYQLFAPFKGTSGYACNFSFSGFLWDKEQLHWYCATNTNHDGIGFGSSTATNLKMWNKFVVVTTVTILLLAFVLYYY
ncbi:uncharacterized protein [Glycine max]|uniref:uncharacterized protein isoform X3 n=1 Tax=Glycine max TaxID=3847 RepID=UPI001B354CB5|nr:uncharacterized protein LOC121172770 isoform X3 [Glycine max]